VTKKKSFITLTPGNFWATYIGTHEVNKGMIDAIARGSSHKRIAQEIRASRTSGKPIKPFGDSEQPKADAGFNLNTSLSC
jgi:hypothetical protein